MGGQGRRPSLRGNVAIGRCPDVVDMGPSPVISVPVTLLDDRLLSMAGLYGLWRDRSQDIYGSRQLVGCRPREKTHQPYRSWRGPQPATSAVAVLNHHTQQPHSRVGYSADPLVCSSDRCLRKLGNGQQDDGIFQRLQFMTVVGNDEQISR